MSFYPRSPDSSSFHNLYLLISLFYTGVRALQPFLSQELLFFWGLVVWLCVLICILNEVLRILGRE